MPAPAKIAETPGFCRDCLTLAPAGGDPLRRLRLLRVCSAIPSFSA